MDSKRAEFWLSAVAGLLIMGAANARVVFFDDFQQFPNGAGLATANYTPAVTDNGTLTPPDGLLYPHNQPKLPPPSKENQA